MDLQKDELVNAVRNVRNEILKNAQERNASVFLIEAIILIGNEIEERLIEKLFGGKE